MKQRQILFTGLRQVVLDEHEVPGPGDGQVAVKTEVSLMSTGTENICFNRLFDPGTHWDNWVKYPFATGYLTVGVVDEVGPNVTTVKLGDRVAHRQGHASVHVLNEADVYPVPEGMAPEHAPWFGIAHITHNGARNANFHLGDTVAVIGAGPIGQMTLRWAIAAGAEQTIMIDTSPSRLEIARKGGATHVLNCPVGDAKEQVRTILGDLPDVVADATGYQAVFPHALGLAKKQGRVLLIGDTGSPAEQRLTPDLVCGGLTLIGAHDNNRYLDRSQHEIAQLFFRLVTSGRFSLEGMNTHFFRPEDCVQAYGLANEKRSETMGILFRW